jgi:Holliday junction resolvase-like predicted endonuclease
MAGFKRTGGAGCAAVGFKGGRVQLVPVPLLQRWRWWRTTKNARSAAQEHRELVAWKAEHAVAAAVRNLPGTRSVHLERRVPNPDRSRGAGEVDVIAVTERALLVIEVKNWAGPVDLVDGDLVQARQAARGGAAKPVIAKIKEKADHLNRCSLSHDQQELLEVLPLVVFANANVEPSDDVAAHPNVCRLSDLKACLATKLAAREVQDDVELSRQERLLERLPTWDTVTFDGGDRRTGDAIDEDLPPGWDRATWASIEVRLVGGWLPTLLRGPRLLVTFVDHDGGRHEEVAAPGATLRHSEPWGASGVDGRGTYPIEHLRRLVFGFRTPFTWDGGGDAGGRDSGEATGPMNDDGDHEAPASNPLDRFQEGGVYTGTVVHHLIDGTTGAVHAVLVALVERTVTGKLDVNRLGTMDPVLFEMFYAVGRQVDVKIVKIRSAKRITLAPAPLEDVDGDNEE